MKRSFDRVENMRLVNLDRIQFAFKKLKEKHPNPLDIDVIIHLLEMCPIEFLTEEDSNLEFDISELL